MDINLNQKKEYVVMTAIDLINESGISNVSTKELAKRVGFSESLIFKMYPKKNDLILAVLDQFSLYDNDIFRTARDKYEDPIEALQFYFNKYLLYYENYPAITGVFQALDLKNGIPQIEERTQEINKNRVTHMMQLIISAQEKGRVDSTADSVLIADILFSVFKGMCIRWRVMNYNFSLMERTNKAINLIMKSILI